MTAGRKVPKRRGHTAFTATDRSALLSEYWAAQEARRFADVVGDGERVTALDEQLLHLAARYIDGVPYVAMARCPLTDEVVRHSLDPFDLDGLWWNYEAPQRPPERHLPPTFFALTGAVNIDGPVADAPFLCKPGPEVPYVIPRLLGQRGVKAVLRGLQVGPHLGLSVTYFAKPPPAGVARPNTWGANHYVVSTPEGIQGWDSSLEREAEYDFDLRPWVKRKKLFWIEPDDDELELQSAVKTCPYFDLPGHRTIGRIQRGQVWWPPPVPIELAAVGRG